MNPAAQAVKTGKTRVAPVTVIRFAELVPNWGIHPLNHKEGWQRASVRYIGGPPGAEHPAPLPGWDFANGVVMAPPGNGEPLHDHHCEECFMVWEGSFEVGWEDITTRQRRSVTLGKYDVVRFPPGVMRGYRNAGQENGFLYFIHGAGEYQPPVFHESLRAHLPPGARFEPYVLEPAYDPATQVVRYGDCPMNWNLYHEAKLPEGQRGIRRFVGRVSGEREGEGPPPSLPDGEVAFVINENRYGSGAPLHDHPCEEIFIPLEGRWAVHWLGPQGERHQALLEPWDACWVPAGVQRGFRNAGRGWGKLHVVQGQPDSPPPEYHQDYSALRR
ncbi:MAG: cupin domain-containing protein [Nitrospinota bacterium]